MKSGGVRGWAPVGTDVGTGVGTDVVTSVLIEIYNFG